MVIFGGLAVVGSTTAFNDTWALSLARIDSAWTQLSPEGTPPRARWSQGAVWDPVREQMVITCGTSFNDTQRLDLEDTWMLRWTAVGEAEAAYRWLLPVARPGSAPSPLHIAIRGSNPVRENSASA
jgi:hypothetical protein